MDANRKVLVSIYYKIYTDNFSDEMIDNMYRIGKYLKAKRGRTPWNLDSDSRKFRNDATRMIIDVQSSYQKHSYRVFR